MSERRYHYSQMAQIGAEEDALKKRLETRMKEVGMPSSM